MEPVTPATGSRGWVAPMRAEIGTMPGGDDWSFELKWDGMRLVTWCRPSDRQRPAALVARARSGRDVTSSFPELQGLADAVGAEAVLDGEAVVFDGDTPSFGRLQHRIHVATPSAALVAEQPVVYMVFDLVELDGRSLLSVPYHHRRRLLEELVEPGPAWRVPPAADGDGSGVLAIAHQRAMEGVMAKRRSSPYRPGSRSRDWLKIKIRQQQEVVVGGWLPGQGQLAGQIGSLLVGVHSHGLRFAGAVGSGLTDTERARLEQYLRTTEECPFMEVPALGRRPVWVEPTLVVEVGFGAWPAGGRLRHPIYLGILPDHDPAEVVRELPS